MSAVSLHELVGSSRGRFLGGFVQEAYPFAGIIQIKFTGISQINHLTMPTTLETHQASPNQARRVLVGK
jgi:hypothetical protein